MREGVAIHGRASTPPIQSVLTTTRHDTTRHDTTRCSWVPYRLSSQANVCHFFFPQKCAGANRCGASPGLAYGVDSYADCYLFSIQETSGAFYPLKSPCVGFSYPGGAWLLLPWWGDWIHTRALHPPSITRPINRPPTPHRKTTHIPEALGSLVYRYYHIGDIALANYGLVMGPVRHYSTPVCLSIESGGGRTHASTPPVPVSINRIGGRPDTYYSCFVGTHAL